MTTQIRGSSNKRAKRELARWLLAGYAGLAGFFVLEATTRKPGSASSLRVSDQDQGTTRTIIVAYGLAIDLPVLLRRALRRAAVLELSPVAAPAGLMVEATGLALRAWSMHTLGASYTRTLRTEREQGLIDTGPYRLIRHPGYTGSLLTWMGFALTSGSIPVVAFVAGLLGRAYHRRILAEELLLQRDLPGDNAYTDRTKKLIPFVW
jgi:protein-S-isoprenylcysteine O-methyltransferase Ste14